MRTRITPTIGSFEEISQQIEGGLKEIVIEMQNVFRAAAQSSTSQRKTSGKFPRLRIRPRALARSLQVKIKSSELEYLEWHQIITQIETRIDNKLNPQKQPGGSAVKPSTKKKKAEDREFYNGIMGEFNAFKDVWRNNIMHSRRSYNEQEAGGVYLRVSDFMERLATKVSEP